MTRPAASAVPVVVERRAGVTLPQQVAGALREAMRDGRLGPGQRVPSTRDLAAQLRVSRSVAQAAYDQLRAEGWLDGRTGSGTYVAEVGRPHAAHPHAAHPQRSPAETHHRPSRFGRRMPRPAPDGVICLRPGVPWVEPTADAGWRRAWREVSVSRPPAGYPEPAGLPELRAALADYLARARGIACRPEEVLITGGTTNGLGMLLAALAEPGDRIGVEDPGYESAAAAARLCGLEVVDLPVDADGVMVSGLPPLSYVYVTPSHQYPLGGRLPVGRRHDLVEWAREHSALVVEDDYDSEFRYDVAPLPALAHLDRQSVVHLGTVSKTLGPSLRLGWLVGDAGLIRAVADYREVAGDWPSWPMQRAYLAMLRDGYVDIALRRARRRYVDRCARVSTALSPYGEIVGRDAGLHVTLLLGSDVDDRAVAARALAAGIEVLALSDLRRSCPGRPGLVVGYGAPTDEQLDTALAALGGILATGREPL